MARLKEWIEAAAEGEVVEAVVVGRLDYPEAVDEELEKAGVKFNVVLPWDEVKDKLNYDFYCGYGTEGCNPVMAWTKTKVIGISCYDGSTSAFSLPRNPTDHTPHFIGG